jgi:hypothetical protein
LVYETHIRQKSDVIKNKKWTHHLRKYLNNYLCFSLVTKSIQLKLENIETVDGSDTNNVGDDD